MGATANFSAPESETGPLRHLDRYLDLASLHSTICKVLSIGTFPCVLCKSKQNQTKLVFCKRTPINDVRRFSAIFNLPTISDDFYPITSNIWGLFGPPYLP